MRFIHFLISLAHRFDQFTQSVEVLFAAIYFLVEDHAIKSLLGRLRYQLFRQRNMLLAGKTKAVNHSFDLIFGIFDPLGNLHLLLARQQRDLEISKRIENAENEVKRVIYSL